MLPKPGGGPGGGSIGSTTPDGVGAVSLGAGGAGGYGFLGQAGNGAGGQPYGNRYLLPLLGGSGGAGGADSTNINEAPKAPGEGGGGGGGALMLASSGTLRLDGRIEADGGEGGSARRRAAGGGGSGGGVRLVAQSLVGAGRITATGGHAWFVGGKGRIRLEAYDRVFVGTTNPVASFATPGLLRTPLPPPALALEQVGEVEVPPQPVGRFDPPDMVIDASEPLELAIGATQIPPGTVVEVTVWNESTGFLRVESTPLEGDLGRATATAVVGVSHGFSRISLRANWE